MAMYNDAVMKSKFRTLLTVALLSSFLAACAQAGSSSSSIGAGSAASLDSNSSSSTASSIQDSSSSSSSSSSENAYTSSTDSSIDVPDLPAYYDSVDWSQSGATLKSSLHNLIAISTAGWNYPGLWDAYKTTDVRPDGTVWDIYSDQTTYEFGTDQNEGSASAEGDNYNREHMIPQSIFNKGAPMVSDAFHVLPSDSYVNNRRSNYPHGNVESASYISNDGYKLGSSSDGSTVFEPKDSYKGDIARIYFYFVTAYQNKLSSFKSYAPFDKTTYPSITSSYLEVYMAWSKEDPVSEKEINRNEAIFAGQRNRNPFVDYPGLEDRIWGEAI